MPGPAPPSTAGDARSRCPASRATSTPLPCHQAPCPCPTCCTRPCTPRPPGGGKAHSRHAPQAPRERRPTARRRSRTAACARHTRACWQAARKGLGLFFSSVRGSALTQAYNLQQRCSAALQPNLRQRCPTRPPVGAWVVGLPPPVAPPLHPLAPTGAGLPVAVRRLAARLPAPAAIAATLPPQMVAVLVPRLAGRVAAAVPLPVGLRLSPAQRGSGRAAHQVAAGCSLLVRAACCLGAWLPLWHQQMTCMPAERSSPPKKTHHKHHTGPDCGCSCALPWQPASPPARTPI